MSSNNIINKFIPLKDKGCKINKWIPETNFIIWGAGVNASKFFLKLKQFNKQKKIIGFFETKKKYTSKFNNTKIYHPNNINNFLKNKKKILVIKSIPFIDNNQFLKFIKINIKENCKISFIPLSFFYRPEAVIEISQLSLFHYDKIVNNFLNYKSSILKINKLNKMYKDLYNLDLSGAKDPISNPDLDKIISKINKNIFLTLVTNLDVNLNIDLINNLKKKRKFMQVVIVINEINLKFRMINLKKIKKIITQLSVIEEINSNFFVRIRYEDYKLFPEFKKIIFRYCKNKIKISDSLGYINSYENILSYLKSKKWIDKKSQTEFKYLSWNLNKYLSKANMQKNLPCLCQRIFPVINFNDEINVCHLYDKTSLGKFNNMKNKKEIINKRKKTNLCRKCQANSLHRLDISILDRK